ncbi:MAG: hypothetical protein PF486_05295, partial [Prolixibacteraceae bacterium]|nr:hypothetical protein [Prolixibacteraceae bacterium]
SKENDSNAEKDIAGCVFKITPPPIHIQFTNPQTGVFLGAFKEKDGLLTFEGNVDEAGDMFVKLICETFAQRIEHLMNR